MSAPTDALASIQRAHFRYFLREVFRMLHRPKPPLMLEWYLQAMCFQLGGLPTYSEPGRSGKVRFIEVGQKLTRHDGVEFVGLCEGPMLPSRQTLGIDVAGAGADGIAHPAYQRPQGLGLVQEITA